MKIRLYCIEDAQGDYASRYIAEAILDDGDIRRSFGKSPVEAFGYLVLTHGKHFELGLTDDQMAYITEQKLSRHLYSEDVENKRFQSLAMAAYPYPSIATRLDSANVASTEAKS